jgi:hypothetical protein
LAYRELFFFLSSAQSYTLEGLAVYTQYLVSLRVYNPEGSGPETIVVVMTDEGGKKACRIQGTDRGSGPDTMHCCR